MDKTRLEAFSDGVIAIIITIMVLELRPPNGFDFYSLRPLLPVFLSYLLSFIFIAIYWNNHHHLFKLVHTINGKILWANNLLLFFLSLIPFTTAWIGKFPYEYIPVATYGAVLLCAALSYYVLTLCLLTVHQKDSHLAIALGKDRKGKISLFLYILAISTASLSTIYSFFLFIVVALIWLVPDYRVEQTLKKKIL